MKKERATEKELQQIVDKVCELTYSDLMVLRSMCFNEIDRGRRERFSKFMIRARELTRIMEELSGMDILEKTRREPIPILRSIVAMQLIAEGFRRVDISRYFKLSHTTLCNCQQMVDTLNAFPKSYGYVYDIYLKFQERL